MRLKTHGYVVYACKWLLIECQSTATYFYTEIKLIETHIFTYICECPSVVCTYIYATHLYSYTYVNNYLFLYTYTYNTYMNVDVRLCK